MIENAATRYTSLSDMLSGVSLYPLGSPPESCRGDFVPGVLCGSAGGFCGLYSLDDILATFRDTGVTRRWAAQGYGDVWLEMDHDEPGHYQLTAWTHIGKSDGLLLEINVWLEYIFMESTGEAYPAFCVDHLRLQRPDMPSCGVPGRQFASSGLLRRVFGVIRYWASGTGAVLITEIPSYFHTAYLFGRYFRYVDEEMQSIYDGFVSELLGPDATPEEVSAASVRFERGEIMRHGKPYLWPTEMQYYRI